MQKGIDASGGKKKEANIKRQLFLRYAPVALIFILGVAGSFVLLRLLQSLEHERAMVEIEKRATVYTMAIQRALDGHNEVVNAVGGFFESSVEVTRDEFRSFTKTLLVRHDDIQALEWIPRVRDEERAVFEETARKEGFTGFGFTERANNGQLRQAGQRAEYFPVLYMEPFKGNETALGYDLGSEENRREALERARNTGSIVATERITLVQEKGNQNGFLVFRPVYQKGASLDSIEKRRENLLGFAVGVYRIGAMVEEALAGLPAGDFDIYVEDDNAPQDERTLYVRPGTRGKATLLSSIQRKDGTVMATSMAVTVPGRQWRLQFVPTPALIGATYTSRPWEGFILGIVFTVVFAGYVHLRTRRSLKIEKLALELAQVNVALEFDLAERRKIASKLEERNQQLAALQKVTSSVSQSLDLETVADVALETTLTIMDLQAGDIKLLDKDRQELIVICEAGLPPEQVRYKQSLPNIKIGQGLSGLAAHSGNPIVVEDLYQDKRRFYGNTYTREFLSGIYVPLKAKEEVVGTLTGMSKTRRTFQPSDIELINSIGNMVGISIANARLFEEQKKRSQELTSLHEVSRTVSQSLDLHEVAKVSMEATLKVMGLYAGAVRILDKATGELIELCTCGLTLEHQRQRAGLPPIKIGQGIAGIAAQTGDTQVVTDLLADKRRFYGPSYTPDFRSAVYLPLKAKGEVVGVISGMSKEKRNFQPSEIELMGSIGNMVGINIANARLFEQVETKAQEWQQTFDTMNEGVAIIAPDRKIVRANKALADMLGSSPDKLVGQYCYRLVHGLDEPFPDCPTCASLVTKQPCEIIYQEPHLNNRYLYLKSAPMLADDGSVRFIVHTFSDITREKQQQENMDRLYRFSRKLSTTLDLEKVANIALNEILNVLGNPVSTAGIALRDGNGVQGTVVAVVGPYGNIMKGVTIPFSAIPEDIKHLLLFEQKPLVVKDTSEVPQIVKETLAHARLKSFVAIPLIHGSRTVGVLFAGSSEMWNIEPEQISLLETYAGQIAMAIENARLYTLTDAALNRRVHELLSLTDVLASATHSLELDTFMKGTLKTAALALDSQRASVIILDDDIKAGFLRAIWQQDMENPPGLGMRLQVAQYSFLQQAIEEHRPVVIPDTKVVPAGLQKSILTTMGVSSSLIVPLMVAGEIIGTMQFNTSDITKNYSLEEVALAQAIAGHLASVVQNARLYERTEKERSTLKSIIASMAEGLVVVDSRQNITYCNESAEKILDIQATNIIGRAAKLFEDAWFGRLINSDSFKKKWAESLANSLESQRLEFELASKGVKRIIEATVFSIGNGENAAGAGILLRDITREREINQMKTEFVSIASHELRTPMTVIFGFAELLLMSNAIPEKQREWTERIYKETQRLTNIVDDFLDISRIESGRLTLKLGAVSVKGVIEQLIGQLGSKHPSHSFHIDISDDFPQVLADIDRLTQVLYNLTDNAAKYSPDGGTVTMTAKLDSGAKEAIVSVSDKGLGIPEEEIPKLFIRFHRVHSPGTESIRGTGLGLSIVKSLAEMMGGRVSVESQLGKGSTFYVALPLAEASMKEEIAK